jgi:hypothetical protein
LEELKKEKAVWIPAPSTTMSTILCHRAYLLVEKSKFLADLSSSSNKKELLKKLQAAISESDINNDDDSVGSSQSSAPNNGDDCFGLIDLQD